MIEPSTPALQARGIAKRFGATLANDGVSLTLRYGRIHALLGENGAGKSTLLSILYGLYSADRGEIEINGQAAVIRRPGDAIRYGLGFVQQHFSLIPAFTVLENILLGEETILVDKLNAEKTIRERLAPFGLNLPLQKRVGELPVGVQQQVEIAKVLYRRARIMLFDEPTAALVSNEIDAFLETLSHLRERGIAVCLITHRLPEVMRAADEATVLRRGRVVLQGEMESLSAEKLAEAIVGERLPDERYELPELGEPVLNLDNVRFASPGGALTPPFHFVVRQGEILGIAGVAGNGQEEIIDGLLGLQKIQAGKLTLAGEDISRSSLAERRRKGIAYIPQDRIGQALLPHASILENYYLNRYSLPGSDRFLVPRRVAAERVQACIDAYHIQAPSLQGEAGSLSGGHQQRLVISRELLSNPKLIVAHDPTRGLDLRAARFVHEYLIDQCRSGAGAILFSPEWSNLFMLCKRIAALYRGALIEIRETKDWSVQELGRCMVGIR